jgi:C1A family cysteine protease
MNGLGRLPDPPDERDHQWRALVLRDAIEVPSSMVVKYTGRVLDQGQTPRCVAYSSTHLKLQQEYAEHRHYYGFQPDELYARCKEQDGIPNDDGTYLRVALKVMQKRGLLAPSKSHPRRAFTVASYVRLNTVEEIKEAILTVGPVVFGMDVDPGIYHPADEGQLNAPTGNPSGGHAMLAVGWDDTRHRAGAFRVKNSWGTGWGDRGFCWMPYDWFHVYADFDAWRSIDTKGKP